MLGICELFIFQSYDIFVNFKISISTFRLAKVWIVTIFSISNEAWSSSRE